MLSLLEAWIMNRRRTIGSVANPNISIVWPIWLSGSRNHQPPCSLGLNPQDISGGRPPGTHLYGARGRFGEGSKRPQTPTIPRDHFVNPTFLYFSMLAMPSSACLFGLSKIAESILPWVPWKIRMEFVETLPKVREYGCSHETPAACHHVLPPPGQSNAGQKKTGRNILPNITLWFWGFFGGVTHHLITHHTK